MTRRRQLIVAAAIAAGLAGGAIAALIGADDDDGGAVRAPRPAGIAAAPALPTHERLPDGRFDPGRSHLVVERSSVRLAVRAPGTGGRPGWAVRTFRAERRSIRRPSRTLSRPVWRIRVVCAELVRTYRGEVGWLYPDEWFRPLAPGASDHTGACASTRRAREDAQLTTHAAPDRRGDWEPESSVVWGVAPARTRRVTVVGLPGAGRAVPLGPHGAFLLGVPAGTSPRGAAVVFSLRGGRTVRRRLSDAARAVRSVRGPVPGTEALEALTPDPAGGPSLGILVADRGDGGLCIGGAAHAVGDRIGFVETSLGLFWESGLRRADCRAPHVPPTRKLPVVISYGSWSGPLENDLYLERARTERRVQRGRLQVTALCHPSVERVTFQTPRDIRTLIPSPRARAVLAVYDSKFPAGELVVTAHLRDGRTWSERYPLGR